MLSAAHPERSGILGTQDTRTTQILRAEEKAEQNGFGGGWGPGRGHGTAQGLGSAEDVAKSVRVSRGALGTLPLALAVGTEGTVAVTYPVPHNFTHATVCLEVTLQGHGITGHHGWERLNVDSQVAYGEKAEWGGEGTRGWSGGLGPPGRGGGGGRQHMGVPFALPSVGSVAHPPLPCPLTPPFLGTSPAPMDPSDPFFLG